MENMYLFDLRISSLFKILYCLSREKYDQICNLPRADARGLQSHNQRAQMYHFKRER